MSGRATAWSWRIHHQEHKHHHLGTQWLCLQLIFRNPNILACADSQRRRRQHVRANVCWMQPCSAGAVFGQFILVCNYSLLFSMLNAYFVCLNASIPHVVHGGTQAAISVNCGLSTFHVDYTSPSCWLPLVVHPRRRHGQANLLFFSISQLTI